MDAPKSYKDPFWLQLASAKEAKHGLPEGVLSSILTKGERSNNDQVSEAGARTVFQIIPQTRKAVLDKYGIDAYLSPDNAAEAAALLVKESLKRNNGDVGQAVGEYHGGTNRDNWGPRTRSYITRVVGQQAQPQQSTFERVKAQRPRAPQVADILNAYRSGQMAPDDAAAFERDVNAGSIMLPEGETLKGKQPRRTNNVVSQAVADAYLQGRMAPADMESFRRDIKSGLIDVPDGYGVYFDGSKAKTGAQQMEMVEPSAPAQPRPERSFGEQVRGAGEAGLSLVTGAVAAPVAAVGGLATSAIQNLAGVDGNAQRTAGQIAEAMTFQPSSQAGQEQLQAVGDALAPLRLEGIGPSVQAMQLAQMAPAAQQAAMVGARQAVPAAIQRVQQATGPVAQRVQQVAETVRARVGGSPSEGGFAAGSVGSAELPAATVRRERAQQMPVPFERDAALTRGQASRDFEQLQFEKETAKVGETGAALRQRQMNQNEVLQQNFDALVDLSNPQFLDNRAMGGAVDRALINRANTVIKRASDAYKAADEAGELEAPVQMDGLAQALRNVDDMRYSSTDMDSVLTAIERVSQRTGALATDADGVLQPGRITLRQAETLRQYVNDAIDWTDKRQARVGRQIKEGIDQATEGAGGEAYAKARRAFRDKVTELENAAITRKLLNTKRNSDERNIALEDVYDAVIVRSSVDEMNKLRGSLLKAGEDGKQAWANLKAKAIEEIKESGLSQQTDERGNRIMTAASLNKAIQRFDQDGKLDALYGKKQAQIIRDLGDIARDIYTAPPGAVNFSNTASALRVALDSMATFGVTGIPAPAATALKEATKYMRDRQTRNRVREALESTPVKQPTGAF